MVDFLCYKWAKGMEEFGREIEKQIDERLGDERIDEQLGNLEIEADLE